MNNTVYVVTYFYPDGSWAGIIGAYSNDARAQLEIEMQKKMYSDCIFVITEVEVDA